MASPLDLTGNAHDDDGHYRQQDRRATQTAHRDKNQQIVRTQESMFQDSMFSSQESDLTTSVPRTIVNFLGDYTFMLLFNILLVFFGAIGRVFFLMFGRYLEPSQEEKQILHDIPIEQRQQKRELEFISDNQKEQNVQLDDLRRRVQKLEERRKAREKQS